MQIDRPILIALLLFIILLLVLFLVLPEYNTFKQLRTELGNKIAEFNAQYDYYASIDRTYFDLQAHKEDIEKIDDALPRKSSLGEVVYFLQYSAKDNGLAIKNLSLSQASASNASRDTIKTLTFSMDLSGSYSALESFLISLEKSSRIFETANISFNSKPGSLLQNFSLRIKTYSY